MDFKKRVKFEEFRTSEKKSRPVVTTDFIARCRTLNKSGGKLNIFDEDEVTVKDLCFVLNLLNKEGLVNQTKAAAVEKKIRTLYAPTKRLSEYVESAINDEAEIENTGGTLLALS